MIRTFFLLFQLLVSGICGAQETNQKIGSEKGVKEKLMRIKKGLPDMKKNLTRQDENFTDTYNVKFDMGNGIVLFREDEDEKEQSLTIRYTPSYFSGTVAEYQQYYKTLVGMIREVFGPGYESRSTEKDKIWETRFYQAGKDTYGSPVSINISCSWVLASLGPNITIDIYSKP